MTSAHPHIRTSAMRLGGVSLAVAVLLAPGTPASAAMDSNCSLVVNQPLTDGVTVFVTSSVYCATYMDHTAVQVGAKNQERYVGFWVDRGGWAYKYSAGTQVLQKTATFVCNGHGTDDWRGAGFGKTTDDGSTNSYGQSRSLTC